MEDTTYKKVMIVVWCFIILIMIWIGIAGREKPMDGYEFRNTCVLWLGQNDCRYFNQDTQICYTNCDFTKAPTNLTVNQLDSYCSLDKLEICQRYIKVMDYILSS